MKKKEFSVDKKQTQDIATSINSILQLPEDTSVGVFLTKKRPKIPDFVMVFQEALGMLLLKEIDPSTFKILACFWFKKYNIIISYDDPQDKRRNVYIMNPNTAWKGTEKERRKVIKRINPDQLLLPL